MAERLMAEMTPERIAQMRRGAGWVLKGRGGRGVSLSAVNTAQDVLDATAALEAEREIRARLREALEQIVAMRGPVCRMFEVCTHPSCNGSSGAYLIAVDALHSLAALPESGTQ